MKVIGYQIIYGFVKIHEIDQGTSLKPSQVCVNTIIDFLSSAFKNDQGLMIDKIILRSFEEICRLKKDFIYSRLVRERTIIRRAIKIMS